MSDKQQTSDFVDLLSAYVRYAFDNEEAVMYRFGFDMPKHTTMDSFYMSGSLCKLTFRQYGIELGDGAIDTTEFIEWVHERPDWNPGEKE